MNAAAVSMPINVVVSSGNVIVLFVLVLGTVTVSVPVPEALDAKVIFDIIESSKLIPLGWLQKYLS